MRRSGLRTKDVPIASSAHRTAASRAADSQDSFPEIRDFKCDPALACVRLERPILSRRIFFSETEKASAGTFFFSSKRRKRCIPSKIICPQQPHSAEENGLEDLTKSRRRTQAATSPSRPLCVRTARARTAICSRRAAGVWRDQRVQRWGFWKSVGSCGLRSRCGRG